ncbi:MAG: PHP domain-containing protein [Clostridia bacterium]|nr:PHP domain-containing protein [Clostridia bacterium]
MNKICDLHTHSTFSDGTFTPTQLVEEAVRIGLSAVALSDHNTVAGLPEFLAAAEGKPILAVPAVELSTEHNGHELHIVGLFLPVEHFADVTEFVDLPRRRKEESNRALVQALTEAGYPLDYEEIKCQSAGYVNRANIAAAMVKKGYVASTKEAFDGLLSEEMGYYTPPKRLSAVEAIEFLRAVGAVPVWAHPYLSVPADDVPAIAKEANAHGLVGIETRYATYTPEQTAAACRVAQQLELKESGGSDFHGANKPKIQLGRGLGDLCVPYAFAQTLKEA